MEEKSSRTTRMKYVPPESVYIGVRVPRETYDALVKIRKTHEHDMSLSAIVRSILRQYIRKSNGRKNGRAKR
jgi:hypothetical protein